MSNSKSTELKEKLINDFKKQKGKKKPNAKNAARWLSEFFVEKHENDSLNDYKVLIKQLLEFDDAFIWVVYSRAVDDYLLKKYPEQEILKIEKEITEENLIIKESQEKILEDFLGKISFKGLDIIYKGHFFITENRFLLIPWKGSQMTLGRVMGSGFRDAKVARRRTKLFLALAQNIKSELEALAQSYPITYPFNLKKIPPFSVTFSMNYEYKDKRKNDKIFQLVSTLSLEKYKNEDSKHFLERQEAFYKKIQEIFSLIPFTACPNCNNIQEKTLETCEKCGIKLKNRILN
ncbi:MAG: hypothetical protein JSV62_11345 [Promethearchaeota archaeon]|nr:MAG: hypothetical protein JSV62_11345 [Candidatus Lokiarchaeota archaeon]